MSEEERTVEVDPEATAGVDDPDTRTSDSGTRTRAPDPAVYDGAELTTEFNDRVDGAASEQLGRVVGLSRGDDGLTLTVETDDGRLAEFALADPAEGRLDGRLRRLFHQIGGPDDPAGGLVPLTTVDGEVAIDWERVPAAPTNPSLDDDVERRTDTGTNRESALDRGGTWTGAPLVETLLAGAAGASAVVALLAGLLAGGGPALVAVAVLQVVVAVLLVARARHLRGSAVE